ncbi:MAG: ABC transporter permease subunit [Kiritimatiellae bacterium]|nr:ABC transporter permease subunit [Kiritimatiellia bacterium]
MGVILESERKSAKARIFLAVIYSVLALGAVTMVYPFAVMISGSLSSNYDYERHSPAVAGFFDRNDRFMRSLATHFDRFPSDIYTNAPNAWANHTSWAPVAEDRAGIAAFASQELAPYDSEEFRAEARRRADAFMRTLAEADPKTLECRYDPRDVPDFVRRRYGTVEAMNADWTVPYRSFFDVSFRIESRLPANRLPDDPAKFAAWLDFKKEYVKNAIAEGDYVSRTLPADHAAFRDEIRNALAIQFADHGTRDFLRDAFANYRTVADYLFLRGRAFVNTIILVVLSVLASLTVNPLAAYALSRFRLRSTERILLFLLATMAFPAAVTAIPGFLLLRDLGLLNTFAALVLPTVASGMSIFVLKGFFDALPRELYEAAAIDGAGEWTVFRRITLPMTTPILAVNALNSFIHAYASWEWAFLVCSRESHWTLAVWMYQMSSETFAGQPWCVMAGFVLVSIPTATVFLLCQKIILRGIVLPSMK